MSDNKFPTSVWFAIKHLPAHYEVLPHVTTDFGVWLAKKLEAEAKCIFWRTYAAQLIQAIKNNSSVTSFNNVASLSEFLTRANKHMDKMYARYENKKNAKRNFLINLSDSPDAKESPDKLVDQYFQNTQATIILDLSENEWDSQKFASFTRNLQENGISFPKLVYLDLSKNRLDQEATADLVYWLTLPSIEYINLVFNPMSLKRIDWLYKTLAEKFNQEEIIRLLRKVIFVPPNYGLLAKRLAENVPIYEELVTKKHIPHDWAEIHYAFYNSGLYQNYRDYKRQLAYGISIKNVWKDASDEKIRAFIAWGNNVRL